MIGTRLDEVDAPRIFRGRHGWWLVSSVGWSLLSETSVQNGVIVNEEILTYFENQRAFDVGPPDTFSLTVLTSTACNLGCRYCFQNTDLGEEGSFKPNRISKNTLKTDLIPNISEFVRKRMENVQLKNLHLLLFGGEPLLNLPACYSLLSQLKPLGLTSAMAATNGVLLTTEVAKRLEMSGLTAAQITFDGNQEDHDGIRVKRSGGATFNIIAKNIFNAMQNTKLNLHLRVNISHHNLLGVHRLFNDLIACGVEPHRCSLTFAWVGDAGIGYSNTLRSGEDVRTTIASMSKIALVHGFRLVRPSMMTTCQICSRPGGDFGAVIGPDGKLFSCWQSAGKNGFDVGSIQDGYTPVLDVKERWVQCGYEYENSGLDNNELDKLDAEVLDFLYESNRL